MDQDSQKLAVSIKAVSAVLAGAAIGWGIFGILMLKEFPRSMLFFFFFPGYVITIWYVVRTFRQPNYHVREIMWVLSLFLQGAWALFGLLMIGSLFGTFIETWWIFATAASAWALWAEATLTPMQVPIHHDVGEDSTPSKNSQD
jgi:hypothetical protein